MLSELLRDILLEESVSVDDITSAIDDHTRVIINYDSTNGEGKNTGPRMIEVYAYGLTKAGNPVIRAFQPYGDTTSRTPEWKFFRTDRITTWRPTGQTFFRPASEEYKGLGEFNPEGDDTMSIVYKVAKFGSAEEEDNDNDDVFKTNTERNMERLLKSLEKPITLSDFMDSQAEKAQAEIRHEDENDNSVDNELDKIDSNVVDDNKPIQQGKQMSFKDFNNMLTNNGESEESEDEEEVEKDLNDVIDSGEQVSFNDLNKMLANNGNNEIEEPEEENDEEELYKTDTERGISNLLKQLQNPKKIDLSKIPKR